MGAVVTAACVIAKREDGTDAYFYQGVELPEKGLADGEVERLVDLGMAGDPSKDGDDKPTRSRRIKSED